MRRRRGERHASARQGEGGGTRLHFQLEVVVEFGSRTRPGGNNRTLHSGGDQSCRGAWSVKNDLHRMPPYALTVKLPVKVREQPHGRVCWPRPLSNHDPCNHK